MKITSLTLGMFQTNTYIISDQENTVVIDPAADLGVVGDIKATAILLTHGHFDHTAGAAEIGAPIHIHESDAEMLNDIDKSFGTLYPRMFKPCQADVLVKDGDLLEFGEMRFKVMHTPGHSRGSVMYILDESVMFTGDTLFEGSVGRIDGYGGSHEAQMKSLEKIKALDGDYRILPGHGEETTLDREKRINSFLL